MREITSHHSNDVNKNLQIMEHDVTCYTVVADNVVKETIRFHSGNSTIPNGLTNEVLLAILIDRLEQFQASQMACEYNADALAMLKLADTSLKQRSLDRQRRGVEGTSKP